jgi:hypothetical protein
MFKRAKTCHLPANFGGLVFGVWLLTGSANDANCWRVMRMLLPTMMEIIGFASHPFHGLEGTETVSTTASAAAGDPSVAGGSPSRNPPLFAP